MWPLESIMKLGPLPDGRTAVANAGLSKPGQRTGAASSPVRSATPAPAGGGSGASGASVTVSELAKAVGSSSAPEIDTAKVEAVRTAINNGTYQVNAEVIADKLLSNAKDMLRRPH